HFGAGRDVTAGADAGDDRVGRIVAEVAQDLLRGRAAVDFKVRVILELLRHPRALSRRDDLLRPGDRALHSLLARGQLELGAISEHQPAPLDAHAVGHDQDQAIALHRRDHREANAGIAAGRLDDRSAGLELAAALGVLDHRKRDAVLDRRSGIRALLLDPDLRAVTEEAVETDVRG